MNDDEISQLVDATSPGPWWLVAVHSDPEDFPDWSVQSSNDEVTLLGPDGYQPADAEFIAAARSLVPDLLERAQRAETEAGRLNGAMLGIAHAMQGVSPECSDFSEQIIAASSPVALPVSREAQ